MGVNYSTMIYAPNFLQFARPMTFYPLVSQPSVPSIDGRGIFHSDQIDVPLEDGSIFVDQRTSVDILESDFAVLPQQFDRLLIPQDGSGGMPAEGEFEVVSVTRNAGGETNLVVRKWSSTALP
jgi:hypothetical protein